MTESNADGPASGDDTTPGPVTTTGAGPASVSAPDASTTSGPTVREATPDDAAAMVVLRALMFEAMGTPPERLSDPVRGQGRCYWSAQ